MFPFFITTLLLIVIGVMVFPFFRPTDTLLVAGHAASLDEESVNLEIERQTLAASLSELEVDFEQGRLSSPDYDRLKLGFEHRLLDVLDRLDSLKKEFTPKRKRKTSKSPLKEIKWIPTISLSLLLVGGSTGVYNLVHWKFEREAFVSDGASEGPAMPPVNPMEMVARLEKKLKENPDDLQGQMMIGRSYMALERWDDAKKAWTKVLELDPRNYTAHYRLGEIILSNPSKGTREEAEEALFHFDKALISVPQDASILWARGIALLQLGRIAEADETWTEAFQYIPRNTESSEMVRKALEDIRAGRIPGSE
ncbi:MAG: tetratricopeptide repeat protein [Nitrospiria bacterium]